MKPTSAITVVLFAKGLLPVSFVVLDLVTFVASAGVAVIMVPLLRVFDLFRTIDLFTNPK